MNLLLWICLTLFAFALMLLARVVGKAPLGYEDRNGFHFGGEPSLVPVTVKAGPYPLPRILSARARQVQPDEIAA